MNCPTCSSPAPAGAKQCSKCGVNFVGWAKSAAPDPAEGHRSSIGIGVGVAVLLAVAGWFAWQGFGFGGEGGVGAASLANSKLFLKKASAVAEKAEGHTQQLITELEKTGEVAPGQLSQDSAAAGHPAAGTTAEQVEALKKTAASRARSVDEQLGAASR